VRGVLTIAIRSHGPAEEGSGDLVAQRPGSPGDSPPGPPPLAPSRPRGTGRDRQIAPVRGLLTIANRSHARSIRRAVNRPTVTRGLPASKVLQTLGDRRVGGEAGLDRELGGRHLDREGQGGDRAEERQPEPRRRRRVVAATASGFPSRAAIGHQLGLSEARLEELRTGPTTVCFRVLRRTSGVLPE